MSERITRTQVDTTAEYVSKLLPKGTHVVAVGRNGYTALDLCYEEADGNHVRTHVARTLRAGTKREMYEYLLAMREGILLSREGQS